jgi:PAS domain S-box-containing protein
MKTYVESTLSCAVTSRDAGSCGRRDDSVIQDDTVIQAMESLPGAIWIQDTATGQILYVNAAYEALWGHPVSTLYRNPLSFLDSVHPEDRQRLTLVFCGRAGQGIHGEVRIIRPDGKIVWIECHTSSYESQAGRARCLTVMAQDITERKEAAGAVVTRLQELEYRNAELEAFAHTVAHNLRSSMGLISGNARLLEEWVRPCFRRRCSKA